MYKLRTRLVAHELDVRSVASISDNGILSGSRDGTARLWDFNAPLDLNTQSETFFHSPTGSFVNAVAFVNDGISEPLAAVGGKDSVIYLTDIHEKFVKPGDDFGKYQMVGHQGNVCSLEYKENVLISGSWDCTAKVWDLNLFSVKYDLVGHQASVWDARIVDAATETYITCSADRTIKKWVRGKEVACYTGHNDVVRKLLVLPGGKKFVLASNDCTLKIWDIETGNVISTLQGHDSFIYDVGVLSNGDLVSTAEDRSVRIWRNGAVRQAITLPCISVWCVSILPNDDIAVGGSDNLVYVFTTSDSRAATADGIREFQDLVKQSAISEQSLDDLKKTDIPGYDRLDHPGKEEGSTVMVKSPAGVIEAHQWSGGAWVKIGDVVNSAGASSGKQEYKGQQYDYVFDVDVEDGKPPLKLPYNANENPYTAAERFLADNELPSSYTEEVVQFINKNTAGFQLDLSPGTLVEKTPQSTAQPSSTSKLLPQKLPILYKDYKAEQLIKGFAKFNLELTSPLQDQAKVNEAITNLDSANALFLITDVVPHILSKWTKTKKLIGFDLLRVAIPRVTTVDLLKTTDVAETILQLLISTLDEIDDRDVVLVMMVAKVLANLTSSVLFTQIFLTVDDLNSLSFNEYFVEVSQKLLIAVKILTTSELAQSSKHFGGALLAIAAFVFDVTALAHQNTSLKGEGLLPVASLLNDAGEDIAQADAEAAYRALVAYGNLKVINPALAEPPFVLLCKKLHRESRFLELYNEFK